MGSAGERSDKNDTFQPIAGARRRARVPPGVPSPRISASGAWTWAQFYDQTRAIADGLLGLDRSHTIAIVGANRPKLY